MVFDFDYTLADATAGIAESYNYAFGKAGMPTLAVERIRKTVGMTVADALRDMCACDENLIEEMKVYFTQRADEVMLDNTVLFPHTRPLLLALTQNGIKTGIVSTKFRYRIEDVFRRENLLGCIGVIIGVEDCSVPKPDPQGLLKALRTLNVEPGTALYVGDHVIDAKAALCANVDFAAALTGTTTREEFSAYPCRCMLRNAGELAGILKL